MDLHNLKPAKGSTHRERTRERSSIEGVVGTKAGDAVIDAVLNKGESYQAKDVVINGNKYFVAYEPLKNEEGDIYGMAFVGLPKKNISAYISYRVRIMMTVAGIFIIILTLTTIHPESF